MSGYGANYDDDDLEQDDDTQITPQQVVAFVGNAVRHNLLLAIFVAVVVSLGTGVVASALPLEYGATFKIFFQDGGAVTSTLASGHAINRDVQGARGLTEYIFAEDNLESIVREAKLVERWPLSRPAPLRFKDSLREAVFGPVEAGDLTYQFQETLEDKIVAEREGDSVRVTVSWRDAEGAYEIAKLLQRNFLADRAARDLGPIRRAIPVVERQLEQAEQELQKAIESMHAVEGTGVADTLAAAQAVQDEDFQKEVRSNSTAASEVARRLSAVRREQREIAETWRRRAAELRTQLDDAEATYSDAHPKVLQLRARLAAAEDRPAKLDELQIEEAQLERDLGKRTSMARVASPSRGGKPSRAAAVEAAVDETELAAATARLVSALRKSNEIDDRLQNATIELATAEVDFQHRYVVVERPRLPGGPENTKKKSTVMVAGLVIALLLGVVAAVIRQYYRGRLEELWQVRSLGVPLLAEVSIARLPSEAPKEPPSE